MKKESLKKIKFALEWFKTGNATEAARQLGYKAPSSAAQRLKADEYVEEQMSMLREIFSIRNAAMEEKEVFNGKIATIEEVLAELTGIMRGDDDKTGIRERLKAAEDLLKYYDDASPQEGDNKETGIIFLPEVKEEEEA